MEMAVGNTTQKTTSSSRKHEGPTEVLLTALAAPTLPDILIPRKQLNNPFTRQQIPQLTVMEATAGYGKTCTTQMWLQESGHDHRWLSMVRSDKWQQNDDRLFWQYLVRACEQLLTAFEAPKVPAKTDEQFIVAFLNALIDACTERGNDIVILVIDNVHNLNNNTLHNWLDFFSSHLPPQLKLVMLSRGNIKVSHRASRMAAGKLTALNDEHLCFNEKESTDFLKACGQDNKHKISSTLQTISGWPLGLKLASLSNNSANDVGLCNQQRKLIYQYLIEDVFLVLPQPLANLINRTICLDQLQPEILDTLLQDINGEQCIELLQANGIFLNNEDNKHFYQPLFAKAVREHLHHNDKQQYRDHCLQAAKALESHGMVFSAIELLAQIDAWPRLGELVISASGKLIRSGDYLAIDESLALIPKALIKQSPRLMYLQVLTASQTKSISLSEQYSALEHAEQLLLQAIEAEQSQSIALLSQLNVESSKQALNLLEEIHNLRAELSRKHGNSDQHQHISWDTVRRAAKSNLLLGSATDLGRGLELYLRGKTQAAQSALEDAIRHAQQENYQLVLIIAAKYQLAVLNLMGRAADGLRRYQSTLNWISSREKQIFPEIYLNYGASVPLYCELDQLDLAEQALAPYLSLTSHKPEEPTQNYTVHLFNFQLLRSQGRYAEAELALTNAQAVVLDDLDNWNWCVTPLAAHHADLALMQDDLVSASHWAKDREPQLFNSTDFRSEEERLILARVMIKQQRFEEAEKLLYILRQHAQQENRLLHVTRSLVLEAISNKLNNKNKQANKLFSQALQIAESSNFQRVFLDEGGVIVSLLHSAIEGERCSEYSKNLLRAYATNSTTAAFTGQGVLVEPLSIREVEILQLVGEGLRNKEIAEKLSISISTVKAHIYNIFSKLQAKSRTEAVAESRKLGII
ncbi:MAG: LuxR family maltose regulon positive regulatory protein [Oceanicoccus sp.]|jgi:LuxR family maltose regulon positive regulatory protein